MDKKYRVQARKRADLCKVFGNIQRVLIVWALCERELSVSEIAAKLDSSLQNTSQHLNLMKDKGVLVSRREGREIYYRIVDREMVRECPIIKDHPNLFVEGETS
jgi:ArsR family transcriptional regulator